MNGRGTCPTFTETRKEPRNGRAVQCAGVVLYPRLEPLQPPSIDLDCALAAPGHSLADKERLGKARERL